MAIVRRLEPVVAERVNALIQRLQGFKDVDGDVGVVKANHAFAALTNGKHRPLLMVWQLSVFLTTFTNEPWQTSYCNTPTVVRSTD